MQVSSVLTVTTSLLAGIAQADDCVDGLIYCGQTLLNTLGVSAFNELFSEVEDATSDLHILDSLFYCCGDDTASPLLGFCPLGCVDAGENTNDHCAITLARE